MNATLRNYLEPGTHPYRIMQKLLARVMNQNLGRTQAVNHAEERYLKFPSILDELVYFALKRDPKYKGMYFAIEGRQSKQITTKKESIHPILLAFESSKPAFIPVA